MEQEIFTQIKQADMVLVGLGEEFDDTGLFRGTDYQSGREHLEELEKLWLLPSYDERFRAEEHIKAGLKKLAELLCDKNYFIVSTAMNPTIAGIPWKEGCLVMPCGSSIKKQCVAGCANGLQKLEERDENRIEDYLNALCEDVNITPGDKGGCLELDLGRCQECGKPLVLNNIYAESYDENGYLSQWQLYTKWLQGTLNKKLLILELGVGMKFPSVIRFPFEKVAYFNQKAQLIRINERLYQLSEELKGKGTSISQNSIDWLCGI